MKVVSLLLKEKEPAFTPIPRLISLKTWTFLPNTTPCFYCNVVTVEISLAHYSLLQHVVLYISHVIDIFLFLTVGTGSKGAELCRKELPSRENSKYWTVPPLRVSLK